MKIYLIRHGQTETNVAGLVCGQMDTILTPHGHEQSKRIGEKLKSISFSRHFVSPLKRAKETASYIKEIQHFVEVPDLMEMNTGEYSPLTVKDLLSKDPRYAHQGRHQFLKYPNGESLSQLHHRISSWFSKEIHQWQDLENVLIVGHEATVSCIIHHLFQIPLDRYPTFIIPNAGGAIVHLDRELNQARLEFLTI